MPQFVIAIGLDAAGNPVNLYTGWSYAQGALDAAGQAGTTQLGYALKVPASAASVTLRYPPAQIPVTALGNPS